MNIVLAAASPGFAIDFNIPPALILGLVVSTILPILVGLVTTRITKPGLRAVLLAALAAITGLGTELLAAVQSGAIYNFGNGLFLALTSFLVAVALHFGLWKPTGVSDKAKDVLVTSKGDDGVYRA